MELSKNFSNKIDNSLKDMIASNNVYGWNNAYIILTYLLLTLIPKIKLKIENLDNLFPKK